MASITSHRATAIKYCVVATLLALFLNGCATMRLETPQLSITNIEPAGSGQGALFTLRLQLINPNSVALPIKGMSYQVSINGVDLLRGASGDIPSIPAYGTSEFTVPVTANLLAAPRLFMLLSNTSTQQLDYAITAKVDLTGPWPSQQISERGTLKLR